MVETGTLSKVEEIFDLRKSGTMTRKRCRRSGVMILTLALLMGSAGFPQNSNIVYAAEAEEQSAELNYLYVGSPYLGAAGEQTIVISWGEGTEELADPVLTYKGDDENVQEITGSVSDGQLLIFTREFTEEDAGIYELESLQIEINGETNEYRFADMGIRSFFGVNEKYEGEEKSEYTELEPEKTVVQASVVPIETSGETQVTAAGGSMSEMMKEAKARAKSETNTVPDTGGENDIGIVLDPVSDVSLQPFSRKGTDDQAVIRTIAEYCKEKLEAYSGVKVYITGQTDDQSTGYQSEDGIAEGMQWAAEQGADVYIRFQLGSNAAAVTGRGEIFCTEEIDMSDNLLGKIQTQLTSAGVDTQVLSQEEQEIEAYSEEYGIAGFFMRHEFLTAVPNPDADDQSDLMLKGLGAADAAVIADGYELSTGAGWEEADSKWYYYENGEKTEGSKKINGTWYYFDSDQKGAMHTGWLKEGKDSYYYQSDGSRASGMQYIDSKYYYFARESGKMHTGWQGEGEDMYCFDPSSGGLCFGKTEVEDKMYYFDETNGIMQTNVWDKNDYYNESGILENLDMNPISGKSTITAQELADYYTGKGYSYPSYYASHNSGASTLLEFCQIFVEEGAEEEIRPEVAFMQTMKETGWLTFGGDVSIGQYNFSGLGAVGGGAAGESFPDVRTGVRAQIQHLKAYATDESLNNKCVDTRFSYVKRASAPYIEWLGIPDNPSGGGWAAAEGYGASIIKMIQEIGN